MKVKICGITQKDDALYAVDLGADILGFIFVQKSPRFIEPEKALDIIKALPSSVLTIGVFADAPNNYIFDIINGTGIKCLQFHGNETPEQCKGYPIEVVKAFRVHEEFDFNLLCHYKLNTFLLDTCVEGILGGTGKTFDWNIATEAKKFGRIILAGGLNPENIGNAIQIVRPYAVDVNSGVESSPGKKDKEKLRRLFKVIDSIK
jgi:phosphoribosylanthranilate isomerase